MRRIHGRWIALALVAGVGLTPSVPMAEVRRLCAGDCDHAGTVTPVEIDAEVEALFDRDSLVACTGVDSLITAADLVAAASHAANGCPAIAASAVASDIDAVARAMTYLATLPLEVSAAVNGGGQTIPCPDGGSIEGVCEDAAAGVVRLPAEATNCRIAAFDGVKVFDGSSAVVGHGMCPDVILPLDLEIGFDLTTRIERLDGTPALESVSGLDLVLGHFVFGDPPCRVGGGALPSLNGPILYRIPSGLEVELDFDGAEALALFDDYRDSPTCDPGRMTFETDGRVRLTDRYAEPSTDMAAVFDGFEVVLQRQAEAVGAADVTGEVDADTFGGRVSFTTVEALRLALGDPCFSAGVIDVHSPRLAARLRFEPDGTVAVDEGADGSADELFDSCLLLPRTEDPEIS